MNKIAAFACAVVFAAVLCGCSSGASPETQAAPEPLNLEGEWKQVNGTPTSYQMAVIAGDTITIYWMDDASETESLYWAGSYSAPTEPTETWAWVSKNDHSQTENAMLASDDDTKDFEYADGQISYKASALGTTKTVRLERASD